MTIWSILQFCYSNKVQVTRASLIIILILEILLILVYACMLKG